MDPHIGIPVAPTAFESITELNAHLRTLAVALEANPACRVVTDPRGERSTRTTRPIPRGTFFKAERAAAFGAIILLEMPPTDPATYKGQDLALHDFFAFGARKDKGPVIEPMTQSKRDIHERLAEQLMAGALEEAGANMGEAARALSIYAPHEAGSPTSLKALRARCLRIVHTNALPAGFLAAKVPYGRGVWPETSAVQHSCAPSATYMTHGRVIFLVALRDLVVDEEVTIAYVGETPFMPYARDRAPVLLNRMDIVRCICTRCAAPDTVFHDVELFKLASVCRFLALRIFPHMNPGQVAGQILPPTTNAALCKSMALVTAYFEQHGPALCAEAERAGRNGTLGRDVATLSVEFAAMLLVPHEWDATFVEAEMAFMKASRPLWAAVDPVLAALERAHGPSPDTIAAVLPAYVCLLWLAFATTEPGPARIALMARLPTRRDLLSCVAAAQLFRLWNANAVIGRYVADEMGGMINRALEHLAASSSSPSPSSSV